MFWRQYSQKFYLTFILIEPSGPLTTLRFQRSLYLLSQPGGPYYPPASVRKAAFKCLNSLFPQGKFLRTIFASAFRLSYPYYNISAFSNVLIATVRLLVVHIRHAWQRFMFLCSDFFDTLYKIVNENLKVKSFLDILYRKKGQTWRLFYVPCKNLVRKEMKI